MVAKQMVRRKIITYLKTTMTGDIRVYRLQRKIKKIVVIHEKNKCLFNNDKNRTN